MLNTCVPASVSQWKRLWALNCRNAWEECLSLGPLSSSWALERPVLRRKGWCNDHTHSGGRVSFALNGKCPKNGYLDLPLCNHNKGLEKEKVNRKALRSSKSLQNVKPLLSAYGFSAWANVPAYSNVCIDFLKICNWHWESWSSL